MSREYRKGLADEIRSLETKGFSPSEIVRRTGCKPTYLSVIRRREEDALSAPMTALQVSRPKPRRAAPPADTCQRPDARKGFATCGDPKLKTRCGESLGVCAYHYATTKPLGGTKL